MAQQSKEVIMSNQQDKKVSKAETYRLRGRNLHEVVNELINDKNASNGWALVKVVQNFNNIDVYLERGASQGTSQGTETEVKTDEKSVKTEEKVTEASAEQEKAAKVADNPKESESKTTARKRTTTAKK